MTKCMNCKQKNSQIKIFNHNNNDTIILPAIILRNGKENIDFAVKALQVLFCMNKK